jgi:uncharacterized protein (DUF885 family)
MRSDSSSELAAILIEDAWTELRRSPWVRHQLGANLDSLPDLSFAEAQRRSDVGRAFLKRLESIDNSQLPHDVALTLRLVHFRAKIWAHEADWYWHVVDPLGIGFFGMFLPTAYCGGFLLNVLHEALASFSFDDSDDVNSYRSIVGQYGRLIDQFTERTIGQRERGILMPKVQLVQARTLLMALRDNLDPSLSVSAERLEGRNARGFTTTIRDLIATNIEPAFDRACSALGDDYLSLTTGTVGLGQYEGGASVYAELVKLHTTLDFTPEEIHSQGCARMEHIERSMRSIRRSLGFEGDAGAFISRLSEDERWRATSDAGLISVFNRYMNRFDARFGDYFYRRPSAGCSVSPLAQALQSSMTFGYYDPPKHSRSEGHYFFNSEGLKNQPLFHLGSLTYHELMPGHHLHLALQHENEALHPFRKYSLVNAFNEGWAEYAATLAGEMGLYEQPEERYGRLFFDSLLTCRLVVDTGMNALGWSLQEAQEYMRRHTGMLESQIISESIRYSCDIPGQALAYKLGDVEILKLREQMREALGTAFDIRAFHAAILGPGAIPLSDLRWHVEHEIAREFGRMRA